MTCADLEVLLCDYVDGTLEGEQKVAVEQHLAACATCAQFARDISTAVAFAEKAPPVEPPDELVTQILYQVPTAQADRPGGWFRGLFGKWLEPVLQPKFAMGMAMTILSFSLLAKFAGIPERQLTPQDLHPAAVWATVDDRMHRVWDRGVKYYESMKVVFEVQSRLAEWSEEEAPAEQPGAGDLLEDRSGASPAYPEREPDGGERSPAE